MRDFIRKLRALLTPAERRRWLALGPMLVLTGLIEMVGTGLVFALIKVAGDPASLWHTPAAARVMTALGWSPEMAERPMVLATGIFVAGFFVIRSLVLVAVTRAQSRAMADTIAAFSGRVFRSLLAAP